MLSEYRLFCQLFGHLICSSSTGKVVCCYATKLGTQNWYFGSCLAELLADNQNRHIICLIPFTILQPQKKALPHVRKDSKKEYIYIAQYLDNRKTSCFKIIPAAENTKMTNVVDARMNINGYFTLFGLYTKLSHLIGSSTKDFIRLDNIIYPQHRNQFSCLSCCPWTIYHIYNRSFQL